MEDKLGANREERSALWKGICRSSEMLAGKCKVFTTKEPIREGHVNSAMPAPEQEAWKLMEALSLLAILLKAENVLSRDICNIFGKAGPFHFIEDNGEDRYLWAQVTIKGLESSLGGRPDLVVTTNANIPRAENILRIVECKSGKQIGAPLIRAEFGKAYDLQVSSYLIWSFKTPTEKAINGARKLGLELQPLGFDTDMRQALIGDPDVLVSHFANTIEQSRKEARFLEAINESVDQANRKLLP